MVNVEADALAGPLLAKRAHDAGIDYTLAYGDQPALICEMVDWARTAGFEVIAAGAAMALSSVSVVTNALRLRHTQLS